MKKHLKIFTLITLSLLASCGNKVSETTKPTETTPTTETAKQTESTAPITDSAKASETTAPVTDTSKKTEESISTEQVIAVESIQITNGSTVEVNEGESIQLIAEVLPENATDKSVIWTCADTLKGTVDGNGLFTANEVTEDTSVEVTAKAGDKEAKVTITIKNVIKAATVTFSEGHYTATLTSDVTDLKEDQHVSFKVVSESGYDIDSVKVGDTILTAESYGYYSFTTVAGENHVTITEKAVDMKGYVFTNASTDPHYASFTADNAVTVYANNWNSNLLVKEVSDEIKATDSYTLSAHIQTETSAPVDYDQLAIGFVAYYQDDSNYLIGYTQWASFDQYGWCREFNLTGFINGEDVGWHDMWLEGVQVDPHDGIDFSIRRESSNFTFSLTHNGTEYKKSTAISALGDSKTKSLGIFNQDKKPVTYSNISYAKYVAPEAFEVPSGSATVSEDNGTVTYTVPTANWKSGFAVKKFPEIADTTKYTISTHLQTTGSTPFTDQAIWGIVLYYQDANNFLVLYFDYDSSQPNSRGLHIIGNKDGAVIEPEWGVDKWTDGTPIYPQNGFDVTVERDGATFNTTVTQGDTTITWNYTRDGFDGTLKSDKVGLWGHGVIGTITATNFKVTV